jgi:large subunit ribosomal protein L15
MNLHDLKPARGSRKKRIRAGRGISAGRGKTAGRGMNGQNSRSGGGKGPYFEGGQLPLFRRLPTLRGFTNINRVEYQPLNVGLLAQDFEAGEEITPEVLIERGYIRKNGGPVVILGDGDVAVALTVKAHRFSKSARSKIEAAGGTAEILPLS